MSDAVKDLLERLRGATGPDRELDGAIVLALGGPPETALPFQADVAWTYRGGGEWFTPSPRSIGLDIVWKCPPYTASLDAALALVEAKLPGVSPAVGQNVHHGYWHARLSKVGDEDGPFTVGEADAPTPALALLIALLEALKDKEHG